MTINPHVLAGGRGGKCRPAYIVRPDGCWEWQGAVSREGYGQRSVFGKQTSAHRAMWLLLRGPIPDHLECDHLCRNRWCVNLDHIELVTPQQNMARGEAWPKSRASRMASTWKTTPEQRDEGTRRVRAGESVLAVARSYGVNRAAVQHWMKARPQDDDRE